MRAIQGQDVARRTELVEKLKVLSKKARLEEALKLQAQSKAAGAPPPQAAAGSAAAPVLAPVVEYSGRSLALVLEDLEKGAAIHTETMKVIEGSQEWKDYDSHISFEMMMLKHRYQSSKEYSMTAARRAQMQAHLRAKQQVVMEQHAEMAARAFFEGMTSAERAALKERLLRIDAPPAGKGGSASAKAPPGSFADAAAAPRHGAGADDDAALRDALWQLSKDVGRATGGATGGPSQQQQQALSGGAQRSRAAPAAHRDAVAGRTLREIDAEVAALRNLQQAAPGGSDSDAGASPTKGKGGGRR